MCLQPFHAHRPLTFRSRHFTCLSQVRSPASPRVSFVSKYCWRLSAPPLHDPRSKLNPLLMISLCEGDVMGSYSICLVGQFYKVNQEFSLATDERDGKNAELKCGKPKKWEKYCFRSSIYTHAPKTHTKFYIEILILKIVVSGLYVFGGW